MRIIKPSRAQMRALMRREIKRSNFICMLFHQRHIRYLLLYLILFSFLLSHPEVINAQHQERQIIIYNVAFGALTGGIGAAINKPTTVNWRKAFVRGCWQGSIGGVLTYS